MQIETFEVNGTKYFQIRYKWSWSELLDFCLSFELTPLVAGEYVELASCGREMLHTIYRTGTRGGGYPHLLSIYRGGTNTVSGFVHEDVPFPVICKRL
jgi:hypothetical protein